MFLATVLALSSIHTAHAHRWFLNNLPNSDRIPCPEGVDCHGTGICSGFGHVDCFNGPRGPFGHHWEGGWILNYCQRDSDGDGLTNGDEMGDPCCVWNYGDKPLITDSSLLSHPGDPSSRRKGRSCLLDAAVVPDDFQVTSVSSTSVAVKWIEPEDACTCTWRITVEGTEKKALHVRRDQNPFVICGLLPDTNYNLTIRSENLAGVSDEEERITIRTKPNSESILRSFFHASSRSQCSHIYSEAPLPAGRVFWKKLPPYHVYAAAAAFVAAIAAYILVDRCCLRKPQQHKLVYSITRRSLIPPSLSQRVTPLRMFNDLTLVHVFATIMILGSVAFFFQRSLLYTNILIFPYGGGQPVGRAIGYSLLPLVAVVTLPVAKATPWCVFMGLTYDTTLKIHRYSAALFVALTLAHAVLMTVSYSSSALGLGFMLSAKGSEYPVLPATIAFGLIGIIGITSLEPIRRAYYSFFRLMHWLFLPTLVCMILHYPPSLYAAAGGLAFVGLTYIYSIAHNVFCPSTIVSKSKVGSNYSKIVIHKSRFNFAPGQWIMLWIPKISMLPHPVSITSFVDGVHKTEKGETVLTFFVKNTKPGSGRWTDALYEWEPTKQELQSTVCGVQGPFGVNSINMDNHNDMVVCAGGVGITPVMSRFFHFINSPPTSSEVFDDALPPRTATMIWVCRSAALMSAVLRHCLDRKGGESYGTMGTSASTFTGRSTESGVSTSLLPVTSSRSTGSQAAGSARAESHLQLFVTGDHDTEQELEDLEVVGRKLVDRVDVHRGRPPVGFCLSSIKELVVSNHTRASELPQKQLVPILTCGPDLLVTDVKREAHIISDSSLEFVMDVEGFEW